MVGREGEVVGRSKREMYFVWSVGKSVWVCTQLLKFVTNSCQISIGRRFFCHCKTFLSRG